MSSFFAFIWFPEFSLSVFYFIFVSYHSICVALILCRALCKLCFYGCYINNVITIIIIIY